MRGPVRRWKRDVFEAEPGDSSSKSSPNRVVTKNSQVQGELHINSLFAIQIKPHLPSLIS
jgi:hypothetical protein